GLLMPFEAELRGVALHQRPRLAFEVQNRMLAVDSLTNLARSPVPALAGQLRDAHRIAHLRQRPRNAARIERKPVFGPWAGELAERELVAVPLLVPFMHPSDAFAHPDEGLESRIAR